MNHRDFCGIIERIEPYYKTSLLSHIYDKLEKLRELFQVSRRQNHIAQQVTLCLYGQICDRQNAKTTKKCNEVCVITIDIAQV